jgi:hypothetical protein
VSSLMRRPFPPVIAPVVAICAIARRCCLGVKPGLFQKAVCPVETPVAYVLEYHPESGVVRFFPAHLAPENRANALICWGICGRPAPPAVLDAAEAGIWRAITGALPPTWFDSAAQQLLLRAVAQGAVCEAWKRGCVSSAPRSVRTWRQSAFWRPGTSPPLSQLLTPLRAPPRGRTAAPDARRQLARVRRIRPWELRWLRGEFECSSHGAGHHPAARS